MREEGRGGMTGGPTSFKKKFTESRHRASGQPKACFSCDMEKQP